MRRIALIAAVLAAAGASLAAVAGADDTRTYEIEMFNAFGLVEGSDVRISGVNAGSVQNLEVNEEKRAVVTVELSGPLARLGEDTTCSSEPQSLIAEYFIDCEPAGPELGEGGRIPAEQVAQTVQPDLVQSTLREPFRDRLRLLINEFGTALAGNPEDLNEAIRLGAPALRQIREVTKTLGEQNSIIRDLNVNSDRVIGELEQRSDDVVSFIQEARDTSQISITRREQLSRNFEVLDDFLAELEPSLAALEDFAVEQTPLLADLRTAAPELDRFATVLPPFNRETTEALNTLGPAAEVGRDALRRGRDELKALARSGLNAPASTEMLADLLRDLDDPRRAVEIDDRAETDTGRTNPNPGQPDTKGYTGFEGLLNYAYYFSLGTNSFDQIGHKLAITLYEVFTGPCGAFSSGRDPETGEPGVPAEGGGTTTDLVVRDENGELRPELGLARCAAWLGDSQPGLNDLRDSELPKYDPAVCAGGVYPERVRDEICDPNPAATAARERRQARQDRERDQRQAQRQAGGGDGGGGGGDGGGPEPTLPDAQGPVPGNALDNLLGIPKRLDNLGKALRNNDLGLRQRGGNRRGSNRNRGGSGGGGGLLGGTGRATQDLLDFLFN